MVEPWLRGPLAGVHPLVMPVFFSFAQVREDLANHTHGLPDTAVWQTAGSGTLGFHLKHLAGSVDRLTTYLRGLPLNDTQLNALARESEPPGGLQELLAAVDGQLAKSETHLREIDERTLYDARAVGRQALPTTVIGLLVHLCEHTQRHLGQAITIASILRRR